MPIDMSFVGRQYPPTAPYEVGREKIREFADAIGDPSPIYRDPDAAKALGHPDVIAPPTFPVVLSLPASSVVVRDPELGADYSRLVHGEQRFDYRRPITAGDVLQVRTTLDAIRSAGGNDILTTRSEVCTTDGDLVVTAISTVVLRGAAAVSEE